MARRLRLTPQTRRRRLSLTPMIDVVFLLLVFFLLASRFGVDRSIDLNLAKAGAYAGPPRLVAVDAKAIRLNGASLTLAELPGALERLVSSKGEAVVLTPMKGASVDRLVAVIDRLRASGFKKIVLAEDPS